MVDSSQAFRNLWQIWRITGIHPPQHFRLLYFIFSVLFNITTVIYLPFGTIIYILFIVDFQTILKDFYFYMANVEASLQFLAIYVSLDRLYVVDESFKVLDKQPKTKKQFERIKSSIRIARKIFYLCWIMFSFVVISQAIAALYGDGQKLITDIWFPYNWKSSQRLYWSTFMYEFIAVYFQAYRAVADDIYGPIYLMLLCEHFKCLIERMENIGKDEKSPNQELLECIYVHEMIINIFNNLQVAISFTMFLTFCGTALMLSFSTINILYFKSNLVDVIAFVVYIVSITVQILPCCYYGDKFLEISNSVIFALYSSNWMDQSQQFKKSLLTFMVLNQKEKMIRASNVFVVNLSTFMGVVKLAYSVTAMLSRMK